MREEKRHICTNSGLSQQTGQELWLKLTGGGTSGVLSDSDSGLPLRRSSKSCCAVDCICKVLLLAGDSGPLSSSLGMWG